jgi:hypothetical protein
VDRLCPRAPAGGRINLSIFFARAFASGASPIRVVAATNDRAPKINDADWNQKATNAVYVLEQRDPNRCT